MKIELERWEVNMILCALEELPREEAGMTMQRIEEQIQPVIINCVDCAYYQPVERNPIAKKLFDLVGIGNMNGWCKKISPSPEEPILTRPDGYCHRAKPKETE